MFVCVCHYKCDLQTPLTDARRYEGEIQAQLMDVSTNWIYTTVDLLPVLKNAVQKLPSLRVMMLLILKSLEDLYNPGDLLLLISIFRGSY